MKLKRQQKKNFKEFANIHDLVYFGGIEKRDEIVPIKGVTFTKHRHDTHYMHGNVQGREVSFAVRSVKMTLPNSPAEIMSWTIGVFELADRTNQHVYVDAHRYSQLVYKNIFAKFTKLKAADAVFNSINQSFTRIFHTFCSPESLSILPGMLDGHTLQTLSMNYAQFDFEIDEDKLYIYYPSSEPSMRILSSILEEGIWLANHIDHSHFQTAPPKDAARLNLFVTP